jgi:carboxymethylenebutenolidase
VDLLNERQIEIRTAAGTADAVVFRPKDAGPWPGAIHLTDIGGIRPSHREMAQRLAAEGYVVLMPNVFYRTARPPVFEFKPGSGDELAMKRFAELTAPLNPGTLESDAASYVDCLAGLEGVRAGRFGVVGYCYTGAMAMRTAAVRPDAIAAAASFHGGRLYTDQPDSPHLLLPRIKARLYFAHAVKDRSMPAEAIERFDEALKEWGGEYESEVYEGAYHSWTASDSPAFNPAQAERAFEKLRGLFLAEIAEGG